MPLVDLFSDPARLKELMHLLDGLDGKTDGVIHQHKADMYLLKKLPETFQKPDSSTNQSILPQDQFEQFKFLTAAEKWIREGKAVQKTISDATIDKVADLIHNAGSMPVQEETVLELIRNGGLSDSTKPKATKAPARH